MKQPRRPRFKKWLAVGFAAAVLGTGGTMTTNTPSAPAPDNNANVAVLDTQAMQNTSNAGVAYAAIAPNQMLVTSARQGDVPSMQKAVALGAEIAYNDNEALRETAVAGQYAAADYLLSRGADASALDNQALKNAATFGYSNMLPLLVQNGANVHADNDHALLSAATYGHARIVSYLIAAGADVNAGEGQALRAAVQTGHHEIADILIKAGATVDQQLVKDAAMTGHVATLKVMANHGVNLTGDGVLDMAAMTGKLDTINFLIEKGARSTPAMIEMVKHNDMDGKLAQALAKGLPAKNAAAKAKTPGPGR